MRTLKLFLLAATLFAATGCPDDKPEVTNAAPTNTTQEISVNTADLNQPASVTASSIQKIAPDALVKDLYKQHEADKSPFFQKKNRALVDKYFDKNLADLIWQDANNPQDEIGAINADPLYNSHDADIKNLTVGAPKIEKDKATVVASFLHFGEKETVTFAFVQQNSDWKIADIKYMYGTNLLGFFKEEPKAKVDDPDAVGDFEGTYQVGETTCTVKPIKMAFEVRWTKGSGSMIFFADEATRYVSQDKGKGTDVFIFDDESLDTGKFVRADGKEMSVKRIK